MFTISFEEFWERKGLSFVLFSDNVPMKNGEVTKAGFIRLNEMEAEDNDGDTEDSWITLNNMGYNKSLILDEVR